MSIWNHLLCRPIMNFVHVKCRNTEAPYLRSRVHRCPVPDDQVKWSKEWKSYQPPDYTDPTIIGKPWADEDVKEVRFRWNAVDGKINRNSFVCDYFFDQDSRPLNPIGRTGLRGRGILGKWGPNHAADPIVSRLRDGVLEFVAIKRGDTGEWAIPGGMVDAGESVSQTLRREFTEEALAGRLQTSDLDDLWRNGTELYRGYVDDPRNTDNSWMETVVVNFHDSQNLLKDVQLQAGDDAVALRWIPLTYDQPLYASHSHFIDLLRKLHEKS